MLQSEKDDPVFFKSISIIGLGLIGGSLAKALRLRGFKGQLSGFDTNKDTLVLAKASGLFNHLDKQPLENAPLTDLIILAVPLGHLQSAMEAARILIQPGTVVMDVGSVKGTVHTLAETILKDTGAVFIGGHPMAGSERGGFNAGSPILFENAYFFLTPSNPSGPESKSEKFQDTLFDQTTNKAVEDLRHLILKLGALPVVTDPKSHDALAAKLSHLPHLAAAALVNVIASAMPVDQLKFAGGGFRDTTRIAMGDPALWRDIFIHNRTEVMESIDALMVSLSAFKEQLQNFEDPAIIHTLSEAQRLRSSLITRRPSEEVSLYPLRLELEDRPGILAEITRLLADHQLDIKDLALDHARENQRGAFTLSFSTSNDRSTAAALLKASGLALGTVDQD